MRSSSTLPSIRPEDVTDTQVNHIERGKHSPEITAQRLKVLKFGVTETFIAQRLPADGCEPGKAEVFKFVA